MNFRRWFIVLSVLVLCAGLASAQNFNQSTLVCQTGQGTVTPLVRAEGYTELVGDIVLTCSGGPNLTAGNAIPQVNITISMNAPVTSRLLSSGVAGTSEALLLIDEPGSGLPAPVSGFGPQATQIVCPTPASGCQETVGEATGFGGATYKVPLPSTAVAPFTGITGVQSAPNVFQGIVSGNQVTFNGVPVLPPATGNVSRVFRITNIRINAAYLGAPAANTTVPVTAAVSTNPSTVLPVGVAQPTVGFVNSSLTTGVSGPGSTSIKSFIQCQSAKLDSIGGGAFAGTVNFSEKFATAFKTRVAPTSTVVGYGNSTTQNVPGFLYNSESGFILPSVTGTNNATAGLADFGTRLKAIFTNIPTGVSAIYVTVNNVSGAGSATAAVAPSVLGGPTTTAYAQLVSSETATSSSVFQNGFPGVGGTALSNTVVQIPVGANGQAVATWEVVNANPNSLDTFSFGVYVTYTANPTANQPFGTAQVILGYAPSPNTGGFAAADAGAASSTLPIPRFVDGTSSDFLKFNLCQTVLLWPYVTTLTGFNTGFAISNTTVDPGKAVIGGSTTTAQSGTCALYIYGTPEFGTMPTMPITVPMSGESTTSIAGGTTYANDLASVFAAVSGTTPFSLAKGYMFGVCNFQYAHGYAAISDNKAANWVTSYLALVVSPGNITTRGVAGENLNQ